MLEVADSYPVRFQGGPLFYPGASASLTHTSNGPFGVAGDLMGQTELFLAVRERPDYVRELLRIVTAKLIEYLGLLLAGGGTARPERFRVDGRPCGRPLGGDLPGPGPAVRATAPV